METIADETFSVEQINEMEQRRIKRLDEAGIDEEAVLMQAQDNFNMWNSYFNENITRGKDDLNFCTRDQWTAVERSEFTRLFKPAMTFNKIYPAIKQVVGEQRKNKPDLIVRSLTGHASQQQLDLRADLVRSYAYKSQTDLVYQTAFKSALTLGYGAFQIDLDYDGPKSFNKTINYIMIPDATQTTFDPSAIKPHKGDGNFCSLNHVYSNEEFFATYPYVLNPCSYTDARTLLDFQWQTKDTIVVCDYYVKEWYPIIIYKLSTGKVVTETQWKDMQKNLKQKKEMVKGSVIEQMANQELPRITMERQTQDYRIMHYRLIKNQIIDFSEWPSKQLPIVFVDGDSYFIDGRQQTRSFLHEARDAQKFLNFAGSEIAAEIKNRRREQWLCTPDNIQGYEQMWRNPEVQNGALVAKPDPKTGMMPIKMNPWDMSPAIMANFQRAGQDIREILGMTEADVVGSRDISGKAKRERKLEVSMSSYVFFDNLNQAIEQGGRIVNDLLPYVVGEEERPMIVTKSDGSTKTIRMNKQEQDGSISNQLDEGDYTVEIDAGPSFAVQKEVALEFLQQTLQAAPQLFPLVGDLWAKNLDVQFMPQLSERFKTLVPPEILAKEEGLPPPPKQPNPQEMMLQAELANKHAEIQERAEELRIRADKHELEKAELIMKAKKLSSEMHMDRQDNAVAMKKADQDFSAKIAKILADTHIAKHKIEHSPTERST